MQRTEGIVACCLWPWGPVLLSAGGAVLKPPHAGELSLHAASPHMMCLSLLTPVFLCIWKPAKTELLCCQDEGFHKNKHSDCDLRLQLALYFSNVYFLCCLY